MTFLLKFLERAKFDHTLHNTVSPKNVYLCYSPPKQMIGVLTTKSSCTFCGRRLRESPIGPDFSLFNFITSALGFNYWDFGSICTHFGKAWGGVTGPLIFPNFNSKRFSFIQGKRGFYRQKGTLLALNFPALFYIFTPG